MNRFLQIFHICLLFLIPISFTSLKIVSKNSDSFLLFNDTIILVLTTIWTSYLTIELVRKGKNDNIITSIFKTYRNLLISNRFFLFFSNLILFSIFIFILYLLLFYRNIEIYSDKNIEISEVDKNGVIKILGSIKAKEIGVIRIKSGQKHLLYRGIDTKDYSNEIEINIPYIWDSKKITPIYINNLDPSYEEIHSNNETD